MDRKIITVNQLKAMQSSEDKKIPFSSTFDCSLIKMYSKLSSIHVIY